MSGNLKILKLFWGYWRQFPGLFVGGLLIGPVSALQNIITPLFVALGLNQLIKTGHVDVRIIVFASVSLAVSLVLDYFVNIKFDTQLEHKVEEVLYNDIFKFLIHQDYDFFANNFSGSLVTRANRLVKAYSIFHMTFFIELLPVLFSVLFALGIMLYYSLALGGVVTFIWLFSTFFIAYLAVRRIPLRRKAVAKDSVQTGELADAMTNALNVKTFAAEDREIARYAHTNEIRGDYFWRSWMIAIRNSWITNILCGFLQIMVFVGGVLAVEHKVINLPVFLLFQVYILRIVDSLRRTNMIVRQLEGVFGDAEEMTEMLLQSPAVQDPLQPEPSRMINGAITLQDVSFTYSDNSEATTDLFAKLSLAIEKGEKIGLVGPSGGGKTTITKLLLRFMDVQAGSISIDGQDIRAVKQTDLRRVISYVPQEPLLFHRSIKENISYGKLGASDAEIVGVAKKAFAHEFIETLPHGYDTLVGERGVKLSGGQRQRVAIARAMLKDAPILVLDEATSALDSESEKVIQAALWELMDGKTAIVIAHRLSTIQKLDRIIVLENGEIVEDGSHQQLLKRKGLYARLWAHQSGGFIEE